MLYRAPIDTSPATEDVTLYCLNIDYCLFFQSIVPLFLWTFALEVYLPDE